MDIMKVAGGVKMGLSVAAGVGIEILMAAFTKHVSPDVGNKLAKACVGIASITVGGMIASQATDYISDSVDKIAVPIQLIQDIRKQAKEEAPKEETPNE